MGANADATLQIDVEAREAIRELQKLVREGKKTGDQFDRTDKSSKKMATGFKSLARNVTALAGVGGAMYGLQAVLRSSTQAALGFSAAMGEVSTLLPSTADMRAVSDEVRRLAVEFGQSNVEQAKAMYQVISAGAADAAEASQILTVANRLAVGGVTDVATAADGLTSVLNAYGLAAGDAGAVSDALFVGMKAGKTTIGEMSAALGKVAPLAATVGIEFDELVAATAALTKGGISTRESITGLRAIMAAVVKPTSEAVEMASQLGIQFNATALQTQGLAGFMETLVQATGGSADQLAQLFGGVEALVPAMALAGQAGADLNSILGDMETKAGATGEAFDKIAETDAYRLNKALGELKDVTLDLGTEILTVLVPAMEAAADVLGFFVRESPEAARAKAMLDFWRDYASGIENVERVEKELLDTWRKRDEMSASIGKAIQAGMDDNYIKRLWGELESLNHQFTALQERAVSLKPVVADANDGFREQVDILKLVAEAFAEAAENAERLAGVSGILAKKRGDITTGRTPYAGMSYEQIKISTESAEELERQLAELQEEFGDLAYAAAEVGVATGSAIQGITSVADALGGLDAGARRALSGVGQLIQGLAMGGLAGGFGVVGGVAGIIAGVLGGGGQRGPTRAMEEADKQRKAIERFDTAVKRFEEAVGGTPGSLVADYRKLLDALDPQRTAKLRSGRPVDPEAERIELEELYARKIREVTEAYREGIEIRRLLALGMDDEAEALRDEIELRKAIADGWDQDTIMALAYVQALERTANATSEATDAVYQLFAALDRMTSDLNIPVQQIEYNEKRGEWGYFGPGGWTPVADPWAQEEEGLGATDVSRRERGRRNTDMSSWTRGMSDVTGQHMVAVMMSQIAYLRMIAINTASLRGGLTGLVDVALGDAVNLQERDAGRVGV